MNVDPNTQLPDRTERPVSLTKVLEQSERVEAMVEQSAEELASVNKDIKQELAHQDTPPGVHDAIEKSEAVEARVQEASQKLSEVNRALEEEVKDRRELDHQFAEVKEQGVAARYAAFHGVLTDLPNRALQHQSAQHRHHITGQREYRYRDIPARRHHSRHAGASCRSSDVPGQAGQVQVFISVVTPRHLRPRTRTSSVAPRP